MNRYIREAAQVGLLPRIGGRAIEGLLGVQPVVVVMGARQVGKSTLVRALSALADHHYVSLDDLEARGLAQRSPMDLLTLASRMTIDEVQREPDLMFAIKREVDSAPRRQPGRFVLTGSANLLLMRRVSESLAGRAGYITLWPLTRGERLGLGRTGIWSDLFEAPFAEWADVVEDSSGERTDWRDEARSGGYPTPAHELTSPEDRGHWFSGYVQTYLERDLQDLASVDSLVDFQRVMRAACLRLGNLVNQSEISRDVGVSQPTVHRWLNLLETSFQLVRVEPYAVNRTKRLVKSPKLYWSDTGLALHLAGGDPGGAHLENLVLADLLAWRDVQIDRPAILYWRTSSGEEVDLVVESKRGLIAIEIKSGRRVSMRDAASLRTFRDEYRDLFLGGLLLHDGTAVEPMGDGIVAAPWWKIL
ncbi:MAG: ATP-binding protein [Gemmatimonadota bacterium]